MNNQDKFICTIYGLVAVIALPATWINNIAFMNQAEQAGFSIGEFAHAAYGPKTTEAAIWGNLVQI
ncbi:hypothetical protein C1752_15936 [Acaryochloris thomasi RCC1774]|uniref:Uncharacterized protein n=1 Tax=Acaryochloris thomasi RCC1774 TaxID=1764569 RepID=A0A2W1JJ01_9CYAN|nr:hypothetical protein [Acaryochloris thomasi]PZD70244.1 hypothetical protein C1752_15936 [Acaryochloris thomasi RCC1774]